jgi:hypothetical protein
MMKAVDQEIVRLSIEVMSGGSVFCREWSFCSDYSVYTRVTNMDTFECPLGWQACISWQDLSEIRRLVRRMEAKGWTAIWNPNYTAVAEFSRSVSLS